MTSPLIGNDHHDRTVIINYFEALLSYFNKFFKQKINL